MRSLLFACSALALVLPPPVCLADPKPASKTRRLAGEQADGSVLVTTNQMVTPLGKVQTLSGERPRDLSVSPDGSLIAVLTTARVHLFKPDGRLVAAVAVSAGPLGLAWHPSGERVFASSAGGQVTQIEKVKGAWKAAAFAVIDKTQAMKVFTPEDLSPASDAKAAPRTKGEPHLAGLAISPDGQRLYVASTIGNAVAVYDLEKKAPLGLVRMGTAPYRILLSADGKTLFVANRGGSTPKEGEPTAASAGTPVRIDPATDAALRGSLSVIDTETMKAVEMEAGRGPAGLALSADGKTLYVAQADEDTVGIFDVETRKFTGKIDLLPPQDPGFGQIPNNLTLSENGKTLFVACGGINAVAAVDLPEGKISGYFPASWYPIALAERGGSLFVASSKGFGARAKSEAAGGYRVSSSMGTVQFITPAQLQAKSEHTRRVALNNVWGNKELPARPGQAPLPIPERVGEPSVFQHVVFIIKENHTYDLNFGDIPEGNGDPALCLFGGEVTPNQHALARQFVLLDNTYTSGTNSADGHQWTVSGVANSYMEQNFSSAARSYPYDGGDPLAYSPKGFLWNAAVKAGRSVRVYGEFVNHPKIVDTQAAKAGRPGWREIWDDYQAGGHRFQITADTDNAALKPYLHPTYIGFPSTVSDQWRADQYLEDFKRFEASGDLPALSIMLLPNDHTNGTKPGTPTPRALVADNDLAVGRIVEAISHSKFWSTTLILVIEDDSQLGLDHVDGHRTVALCVSPYTRRGAVVSEVYNHTSFLRTMGLVLGMPAMNRFDRTATPMSACFTNERSDHPFEHVKNNIALDELNPPVAALKGLSKQLAQASDKLDFSDIDRANPTTLARAVWAAQKPGVAFPWSKFHPAKDDDDD